MLHAHIPWLADGYRIKLQQEEKKRLDNVRPDDRDNFTLCPEEHISSYAELRVHSRPCSKPGFPQRRVLSAHGRLGGRGQTVGRRGSKGGGNSEGGEYLTDDDKENHPWLSSIKQTLQPRPSSAKLHSPSPSRPSSALDSYRGLHKARPTSALASYRARTPQGSRPTSALDSYRNRVRHHGRPTSAAVAGRHGGGRDHGEDEGVGGEGGGGKARPVSASAASPRKAGEPNKGSLNAHMRSADPYSVRQQRIESARQAWAEDPRSGLHIGGPSPGPAMFMDRHARCFDHTHIPDPSQWDTMGGAEAWGEEPRPDSAMSTDSTSPNPRPSRDHMSRIQRYIDCHRPQTAPTTRKELEGTLRAKYKLRSRVPHFCNFVHGVELHERYNEGGDRGQRGSNTSDDDSRQGSLLTDPTDRDLLAQWRKQSRFTQSGTEGRPGSPSSVVDGQHPPVDPNNFVNGRAKSRDTDDDALSLSVIVNHLVNSEGESILRPESVISRHDDTDRLSKAELVDFGPDSMKDVTRSPADAKKPRRATTTTQTPARASNNDSKPKVMKTFVAKPPPVPRVKLIPTITIPSSPIPPHDQGAGTQRSSGEDSPRKSVREKRQPIREPMFDKAKPKPLPTTTPTSTPVQDKGDDSARKGKRQAVAKKTKKGGDRKRKGKSSDMEELPAPPSADQVPNGDAAAEQPPLPGVEVDVKVPDLPGLHTSDKERKTSQKGEKRAISTPLGVGEAKPQLPPELLELNQRVTYDFGDMDDPNEISKPKFRSQSWINNRMALSQQSSRFELPMDMKSLEKMSTQEYLKKYCIVTSRRLNLYNKIFMKHRDKTGHITRAGLESCLKEVLVETLRETTLSDLCAVLEIADDTKIDFKLFSGVSAIAERILYPFYTTEDTLDKAEYQREKIETADFGALDWKLNGITVSDNMRKLLKMIE